MTTPKLFITVILLVATFAGLGTAQSSSDHLTVILDFFANPSQLPLFVAESEGFFDEVGLNVDLQVPADPSDAAQFAAVGRVDLALTPSFDLVLLRDRGLDLTAVGSLIQSPLGGLMVLKSSGIKTLADLRGKRIGFSLEPEEPALWATMLESVGISQGEYELINIGFEAIPTLLGGQVDAAGVFRNFEPILLDLEGIDTVFFPFEEHGVPSSWQLVFAGNPSIIESKADEISRFLSAVRRAVDFTLRDPNQALNAFFTANPELAADDQRELNIRSTLATLLLFQGAPCHNDADLWAELQDFTIERGLIESPSALEDLFNVELLPEVCN